jgi:hypothetical protein
MKLQILNMKSLFWVFLYTVINLIQKGVKYVNNLAQISDHVKQNTPLIVLFPSY